MGGGAMIRIYERGADGAHRLMDDYAIERFGGTVPSVGDGICEPCIGEADKPILDVIARYFRPRSPSNGAACVVLVVTPRVLQSDHEGDVF